MKNILILFLTISLISCSKDEIEEPNYSAFLNNQTPSFSGKLNSQFINWAIINPSLITILSLILLVFSKIKLSILIHTNKHFSLL